MAAAVVIFTNDRFAKQFFKFMEAVQDIVQEQLKYVNSHDEYTHQYTYKSKYNEPVNYPETFDFKSIWGFIKQRIILCFSF